MKWSFECGFVSLPCSVELGLPALFGLAVLPPELLLRIMRLLDVFSLLNLSEVCRHLHSTTHDVSLWKYLLHRDFGGINMAHTQSCRHSGHENVYPL